MERKAREMGIPNKCLLKEGISMTTKENMICSLLVLERAFKLSNINKILLVTTNYHMRRCLSMAQTYMPSWIEFAPCPADDINTQINNWHKNKKGLRGLEKKLGNHIALFNFQRLYILFLIFSSCSLRIYIWLKCHTHFI